MLQKKESPSTSKTTQLKNNFLNIFSGSALDPRSPTAFINRTPIIWKNKVSPIAKTEFAELVNDSVLSDVSLEILTREEEASLPSLKEQAEKNDFNNREPLQLEIDPRSPTIGIQRTPLVLEPEKKKEDNLLKNVTEKLVSAAVLNKPKPQEVDTALESDEPEVAQATTKRVQLIYEDFENVRYSTPPKTKKPAKKQENRTPLSCLANKSKPYPQINSSTPIKSKNPGINIFPDENLLSVESKQEKRSRIPVLSAKKVY
jgi:hypothetical protein